MLGISNEHYFIQKPYWVTNYLLGTNGRCWDLGPFAQDFTIWLEKGTL